MDTVRSWKNLDYRRSLGVAAPRHPAGDGLTVLTEEQLTDVNGVGTAVVGTLGCCTCLPWYSGWTVCGFACNPPPGCSST